MDNSGLAHACCNITVVSHQDNIYIYIYNIQEYIIYLLLVTSYGQRPDWAGLGGGGGGGGLDNSGLAHACCNITVISHQNNIYINIYHTRIYNILNIGH